MDYLVRLPEGKPYDVEIKLHRAHRSPDQNRLYWLWLTCLADETGHSKDDLHEFFKRRFLSAMEKSLFEGRHSISVTPSTAHLDTKEMTGYLECIRHFAMNEAGVLLPDPREQGWEEFYERYKNFIN